MDIPIPKIDFDDINKFESSCGLFLIVFAVLLGCVDDKYFFCPLWLIIILLVFGATSMIVGLIKWRMRQKSVDEKLGLEIEEIRKRISAATDDDKERNMHEKIGTSMDKATQNGNKQKTTKGNQIKNVYKLLDKLSKINNLKYDVLTEQKISGKYIYDALLVAKQDGINDKVIEIKYQQKNLAPTHINDYMLQLAAMLTEYRKAISKNANAVLLLLYEEMPIDANEIRLKLLNEALKIPELSGIQIEVVKASDIDNFDANILCI